MVGRKIGIVIGTNEYSDSKIPNLLFAEKDARDVKDILLDPDICGFDEVVTFINQGRTQTFCKIDLLLKKADHEDLLLIYFSGHGEPDPQNDLCLLFNDTKLDSLVPTSLNYSLIRKCIDASSCKTVIVILDCCYSGAAGIKGNNLKEVLDKTINKVSDKNNNISGSGKVILSASSDYDIAKEDQKLENGVFTYYLIEGLKNGVIDSDSNGDIDLADLYKYAHKKTVKYSQTPYMKIECEGHIIIGKNPLKVKERDLMQKIPKTFTSLSTGAEFILIPMGKFMMGAPTSDYKGYFDERPTHEVMIKNSFYMGKYPVTQKQWEKVMGSNPSYLKGDDLPVESVSWEDVQEFVKKLNEKEGTDKYRLPSEAEWEYACRASTQTKYSFGDSKYSGISEYAWYGKNSSYKLRSVGQKKPNYWNLYDMHGNVWEWCQDNWHGDYNGAPSDGSAWEEGIVSYRTIRGGAYNEPARNCRSTKRLKEHQIDSSSSIGFRLVREI